MSVLDASSPGQVDDPGGRALAGTVHTRLRSMILSGELPPGAVLPQAKLARDLGVSRTPMREAFRRLQEEGLIDAEPDKRARVRGLDAADLDSTFGTRIALESLGVSMTVRMAAAADVDRLRASLAHLRGCVSGDGDADPGEEWYAAHREFHRLTTAAAAPQLARLLTSMREHCDRYIRFDQYGRGGVMPRADAEHGELVEAFAARDAPGAVRIVARHLAHTALGLMNEVAPEREPVATRSALNLLER